MANASGQEDFKPAPQLDVAISAFRAWEEAKWNGSEFATEGEVRRLVAAMQRALLAVAAPPFHAPSILGLTGDSSKRVF